MVPALAAGTLFLLLLCTSGGTSRGQDQHIWTAIEKTGALPVEACLEGQFLLSQSEAPLYSERLARCLVSEKTPGTISGKEPDKLVLQGGFREKLTLSWQPLPETDPGWYETWAGIAGSSPLPPNGGGNQGMLGLRMDVPGRGNVENLRMRLEENIGEGRIFSTYIARLPAAVTSNDLNQLALYLASELGARVVEGMTQEGLVSLSGWRSGLGPGCVTANGSCINLQMVLRVRPSRGDTLVYVGLPLMAGTY